MTDLQGKPERCRAWYPAHGRRRCVGSAMALRTTTGSVQRRTGNTAGPKASWTPRPSHRAHAISAARRKCIVFNLAVVDHALTSHSSVKRDLHEPQGICTESRSRLVAYIHIERIDNGYIYTQYGMPSASTLFFPGMHAGISGAKL